MNRFILIALALAGCLEQAPATDETDQDLNGDTWTTVDDNGYSAGTGADANGIAISPTTHKVLVAGSRGETNNTSTWIVRGAPDGVTWGLNSTFKLVTTGSSQALNVAADSAGYFYVVGTAIDSGGDMHWIVRRSVDDAASWATVFDEGHHDVRDLPTGLSVDAAGNVFVSGKVWAFGKATARIVRGTNHGQSGSWTEVYTIAGSGSDNNFYATCNSTYNGQPATYAVGWEGEATTPAWSQAMIHYTVDGGMTWLWDYNIDASYLWNRSYGCAGTPSGNLMLAITSEQPSPVESEYQLIVSNYKTEAELTFDGSYNTFKTTGEASYGGIYVPTPSHRDYSFGAIATSTGALHWQTHYGADTQWSTWNASDDYTYPGTSGGAKALNAAYDSTRGLYVVGWAYDAANRLHGIVRHRQ
jgi:hypothetical protein